MASFSFNIPNINSNDLNEKNYAKKIYDQLIQMNENLRYMFENLDDENFSAEYNDMINNIVQGGGGDYSQFIQTANMIKWLVKSGTSESDFTITDRLASLTAANIDLNGYVTFHNLEDPTDITTINGGIITSTAVYATIGEIAGFKFSNDPITGGFIYEHPEDGQYIRLSPYSSHTGTGEYNTEYGAIDLGWAIEGYQTMTHLRSDGYARFGFTGTNGVSVVLNDWLRYEKGVPNSTNTIFHTKNFNIYKDGTVSIKSEDVPSAITGLEINDDYIIVSNANGSSTMRLTKDAQGKITNIAIGDSNIPVTWS